MVLTNKQGKDLLSIKYFLPQKSKKIKITDNDIENFFNYSDNGIKPKEETKGYKTLLEGKRWRGIHMQMYEDGLSDVPYFTILGLEPDLKKVNGKWKEIKPKPIPRYVMEFMAKTMFKGIDKKFIEKFYNEEIKKINKKWK